MTVTKMDLNKFPENSYQMVIRKFDRMPGGTQLKLLSNSNPEWLVEMVEELRPKNLADYEFTEDEDHLYAVELRKSRYPV